MLMRLQNNKPNNLEDAMFRRVAKGTVKVWDTIEYCYYTVIKLFFLYIAGVFMATELFFFLQTGHVLCIAANVHWKFPLPI
jgi:hypothetical protein